MISPDALCMGCMRDKGSADLCPHCGRREGARAESPLQLAPRTVLEGKYLLGRVLGQGGFGITYLAWDLNRGEKLAIKEYFPLAISTRAEDRITVSPISAKNKADLEYGLRKFKEEGDALAHFKDSPGIVTMVESFPANGTAYIVMGYVEGRTFKQYLDERGGRIPFEDALKVVALVMNALEEVHNAHMLHRDISPDNIYIEDDGQTKILDFGATRYAMGEQSQSLSVILKPGYAPEEQYRSKGKQGPWTDIYALGATFYRAITGHAPPEAPDRMAQDELIPPSRYGIKMPSGSEAALLKALAVRAENRFRSVADFRKAIRVGPPVVVRVTPPPVRVPEKLSKAFYVISIPGGVALWFIFNVMWWQAALHGPLSDADNLIDLQALTLFYVAVVMTILLYRAWDAIQDGHARISPGQAIGLLFVPLFSVYWLFQVFFGFSRDYNRFVDRYGLKVSKLPSSLFLASNITYLALGVTLVASNINHPGGSATLVAWNINYLVPDPRVPVAVLFEAISLANAALLSVAVTKACDAVNALAASAGSLSITPPGPLIVTPPGHLPARRMLLHCVLGEYQGDDLELENTEIFIGRNPKQVNWVFSSDEVSGRHVRVWRDNASVGIWVEDMKSTNGTYYREPPAANGQWVRLTGRRFLPVGSRFRLGEDLAEFEVKILPPARLPV